MLKSSILYAHSCKYMKIKIDLPLEKTLNMSSEVILVNEKL